MGISAASSLTIVMWQTRGGLPWWAWVLIILAAVAVVVWLMSRQKGGAEPSAQETATRSAEVVYEEAPPAQGAPAPLSAEPAPSVEAPTQPDNLEIVEGIGPKIAGLLRDAGIVTFAQLASADVEHLRGILQQAGLRHLADPATWGEQAALAAAGKWDELQKLQESLKGGRRAK